MTNFVFLKIGDTVLDKVSKEKGEIILQHKNNHVTIKTESGVEFNAYATDVVKLSEQKNKNKKEEVLSTMKKFINPLQNIVLNFQQKFGHPFEHKPTLPSLERFTNRKGWGAIEESLEQLHTLSNNEEEFLAAAEKIKVALDVAIKKQLTKEYILDKKEKLAALGDGLGDELWFLIGDFIESGIDMQPIIKIIEESNMSKLFTDENGNKYAKNDDLGKIIKSPDFFAPEPKIAEEILRQING